MNELIIIVALTLAGGVFAGAEIAVVALRKTRVQELLDEKRRGASALARLRDDPERFLATVQVGITVIGATAAAFGGASLAERLTPWVAEIEWLEPYAEDLALGAVVMRVPSVTDFDRNPLDLIETGDWVKVDADRGIVEVRKAAARQAS